MSNKQTWKHTNCSVTTHMNDHWTLRADKHLLSFRGVKCKKEKKKLRKKKCVCVRERERVRRGGGEKARHKWLYISAELDTSHKRHTPSHTHTLTHTHSTEKSPQMFWLFNTSHIQSSHFWTWTHFCLAAGPRRGSMDPIVEVVALLLGFIGWVMVGVALPNRYWRVSTVEGNVITTSTIYENLWMSCATDSTGVHNCREFPSLLALSGMLTKNTTTTQLQLQIITGKNITQQDAPGKGQFQGFIGPRPKKMVNPAGLWFHVISRLHPGVSSPDDHGHSVWHLWTVCGPGWNTVLEGRRGELCPEGEDCWHCRGHVHTPR